MKMRYLLLPLVTMAGMRSIASEKIIPACRTSFGMFCCKPFINDLQQAEITLRLFSDIEPLPIQSFIDPYDYNKLLVAIAGSVLSIAKNKKSMPSITQINGFPIAYTHKTLATRVNPDRINLYSYPSGELLAQLRAPLPGFFENYGFLSKYNPDAFVAVINGVIYYEWDLSELKND